MLQMASQMDIKNSTKDYTEFFQVFYKIIQWDNKIKSYLVKKQIIGRFLALTYDTTNLTYKSNQMMEQLPSKINQFNLIGHPTKEIKKFSSQFEKELH